VGRAWLRAFMAPRIATCLIVLGGFVTTSEVTAQLNPVEISNDVTFIAGAETIAPHQAARLTLPSTVAAINLGPAIPRAANVTALMRLEDGTPIFALDTFANLGGQNAGPEDLIAWDGTNYSLAFDGSAAGVPRGAAIDAAGRVFVAGEYVTLLSFDVTVLLPGGATLDDEDIAAWDGSTWSLYFDGSANGVLPALDLDGYDLLGEKQYFSFDGSGNISPAAFDDEDVVAFSGGTWSIAVDCSAALGASFAAGDLDAFTVPADDIFRSGFESAAAVLWPMKAPVWFTPSPLGH